MTTNDRTNSEHDTTNSDHYTTDCESEASFESWIDEENIDVPISTSDNAEEKGVFNSIADKFWLDYFI